MNKLNTTTYKITPNDDNLECFEIEIGDSKQPDFKPQVKLMKWDNEVNFSVRAIDDEIGDFTQIKDKEKIKLVKNKREYYFYKDGKNFEFEVVLNKKPKTNKIEMSIKTKGLNFYYQRELTQEEKAAGDHQLENCTGSYAVYHSTKGITHSSQEEATKYKIGKAFHIFRPKIIDSVGAEVWGELNIDEKNGILSVIIPQEFLDNATYPIRHAAGLTFGNTSVPTANRGEATEDYIYGWYSFAPAESGTLVSYSVVQPALVQDWHAPFRAILHLNSDNSVIAVGTAEVFITDPEIAKWATSTFSGEAVVADTAYMLSMWVGVDENTKGWNRVWDAGGTADRAEHALTYSPTDDPPDPCPWANGKPASTDKIYGVYITYTPTATNPTITGVQSITGLQLITF